MGAPFDPRQQWLDAVERAGFPVYAAVADGGVAITGGVGSDPDATRHLGVDTIVGDTTISVDTSRRPADGDPHLRRQMMAMGIVDQALLRHGPLPLPFTVTVVADDRTIPVDGADRVFAGMRVEAEPAWAGECELDGVVIRVETTFDGPFVIDTVPDPDLLPETPPA